jgi:N-acetylneuraminate synthase
MYGSDQSASLEPGELARLVQGLNALHQMLGDGRKRILESEAAVGRKLRYWPQTDAIAC